MASAREQDKPDASEHIRADSKPRDSSISYGLKPSILPIPPVMIPASIPSLLRCSLFLLFALLAHAPAWAQIVVSPAAGRMNDAHIGESYGPLVLTVTGGVAPYSFAGSYVALPAGMTIDRDEMAGTVTIGGEPTQVGDSYRVNLHIADASGTTVQSGDYHIHSLPSRSLAFTPDTLADAKVGQRIELTFLPQRGQAPYFFQALTALPPGLALDTGGRLSGVLSQAGRFDFQIHLTDRNNSEVTQRYTLQVNGEAPTVAPVSLTVLADASATEVPLAIVGQADAVEIVTSPASGTAELRGTALFYTPARGHVGTDRLQYRARNAFGVSAVADITVQVLGLVQLPQAGEVSISVPRDSQGIIIPLAISGPRPTSVSVGTGPDHGQTLVSGTQITYRPNAGFTGTDRFSYRAHRGEGASPPATVTVQVVEGLFPPIVEGGTLAVASGGGEVVLPIRLSGGVPDRLLLLKGTEHGQLRVDGLALLYTPPAGFVGRERLQVAAENGAGRSAAADIEVDVVPAAQVTYHLAATAGQRASLALSRPDLQVIEGRVLAMTPVNTGRASIDGDTLHVDVASDVAGGATVSLSLVNDRGAVYEAEVNLMIAGSSFALDPSLAELLRVQQQQAQEVASLRSTQVGNRQRQLAGAAPGWSGWLEATMGNQRWVPAGNEHRLRGQVVGLDHRGAGFHAGVAVSRAASRAPLAVEGTSKLLAHGFGAYAGWEQGALSVDAQLAFSDLAYDAHRIQQGARVGSRREGRQWQVNLRSTHGFAMGSWQATAGLELDGQRTELSGFNERLPGGIGLRVDGQESWGVQSSLTGGLSRTWHWRGTGLSPFFEVGLLHRWQHFDGAEAYVGKLARPVLEPAHFQGLGWSGLWGVDVQLDAALRLRLHHQQSRYEGGGRHALWGLQLQSGF